MKGKVKYEIRIRECVEPGKFINGRWVDGRYVKKSKFYFARSPGEARGNYSGSGYIMLHKRKLFIINLLKSYHF